MQKKLLWQKAVITSIVTQTTRVKSFFCKLQQPLQFVAGQHVDVRLTAEDGYQAQRSYSIASAPESSGDLELIVERLDEGEVSPFFHDIAAVGDEIELRGPIGGYFIWSAEQGGPIVLIAGGSGIVPLMSMVRHRAAQRSNVLIALLVSARTWDEVIYRDELLALERRHDGFSLMLTTTRGPAMRQGDYQRRIDAPMITSLLQSLPAPQQCFVCGSNPFVEAASQSLIAAAVSADVIRTERYGG